MEGGREPGGWVWVYSQWVTSRPWWVMAAVLGVTVAAGLGAVWGLGFQTARLDLTGRDVPFVRDYLELEEAFGDLESAVVLIRHAEPERAVGLALALERALGREPELFGRVFHEVDPGDFGGRVLLYAEGETLEGLGETLGRAEPWLERGALPGVLGGFAEEVRARVAAGEVESGSGDEALGAAVGALVEDVRDCLRETSVSSTPFDGVRLAPRVERVWTEGGALLCLVECKEAAGGLDPRSAAVEALRGHARRLEGEVPGARLTLTGKPVLQVDEMGTYAVDTQRSSVLAFVGVGVLLVLALRRLLGPLVIGSCLGAAVVWTLGAAALWPGHLNLLAVVFVVVVIGLGVDYGIHVAARYDQERGGGAPPDRALYEALRGTGTAVLVSAATTLAAFLACLGCGFRGLQEFGGVAGFGVVASLLTMTTALPAGLAALDRWRGSERAGRAAAPGRLLVWLDRGVQGHPWWVLGLVGVCVGWAGVEASALRYDHNLLKLQDPSLPSVQAELELLSDPRTTSWYAAYVAEDLAGLREAAARVEGLPVVGRVESALDVLPPRVESKRAGWEAVQGWLAARPELPETEPGALVEALEALVYALEDAQELARSEGLERLIEVADEAWVLAEARGAGERLPGTLRSYDVLLRGDLERLFARLTVADPERLIGVEDLPESVRAQLVGKGGELLLRVYPREDLWDLDALGAFVGEVRGVLPEVTGVPVLVYDSSWAMLAGYQRAALYALLAVALGLAVYFRSAWDVGVTLLTLGAGTVGMLGVLEATGVGLNPANLVALPMLVGVGVDTAVHVIHHGRVRAPGAPWLAGSLGRALWYSALTSAVGFGSLLWASHPGTRSIGVTISVGVMSCLVAAWTIPVALGSLRGGATGRPSSGGGASSSGGPSTLGGGVG